MVAAMVPRAPPPHDPGRDTLFLAVPHGAASTRPGDRTMQWQTPTATDYRFGFEITLYVSNR